MGHRHWTRARPGDLTSHLQRPYLQVKSLSQVPGFSTSTFVGGQVTPQQAPVQLALWRQPHLGGGVIQQQGSAACGGDGPQHGRRGTREWQGPVPTTAPGRPVEGRGLGGRTVPKGHCSCEWGARRQSPEPKSGQGVTPWNLWAKNPSHGAGGAGAVGRGPAALD